MASMLSTGRGPWPFKDAKSFLGQVTYTPRVLKAPPINGQSASTKQSTP